MTLHVDFTRCTGLGICESVAPDFFEIGDDGRLTVVRADLKDATEEEREAVEEAVRSCPTAALRLDGGDGGDGGDTEGTEGSASA